MPRAVFADLRHALRSLARTPAVSAAAILCLGLALGATTAIYSAVNTALLRPLPFPAADRLVTVYRTAPQADTWPFSPANYLDLKAGTTTLEALTAVTQRVALLEGDPESRRVSVARAADNVFELLGARPQRGRLIQKGDDDLAKAPVAVISAELWRDHFGSNPDVVGSTIHLDGEATEVIGVLPDGFGLPHGGNQIRADFWVTLRFSPEQAAVRGSNFLMLMGRVRPGTGLQAAHAEMRGVMDGIIGEHPDLQGEQLRVVPMHEEHVRAVRGPLLLLLGAVAFVLLISAANVASLLLARGVARRPEFAVRTVLGARRADLLRPALVESGVLAGAGVALGLGLAWLGIKVISNLLPSQLSQLRGLSMDPAVLAVSLLIALVVAVACAIAPAWQAATSDPHNALRAGGRGGSGGRHQKWMRGLLVAEVGLSLVLLLGAGLVLRGFQQLVGEDPGFDPDPLLALTVDIAPDRYEGGSTYDLFLEPVLEAIRALPGVVEAGSIQLVPYDNWGWNWNVHYEGRPVEERTRLPLAENRYVSPSFFGVLGQTLLAGRLLNESDGDGAEFNVVVNEALVKRDFPGEDALGKRFHRGETSFGTIVGVVSDIKNAGPERPPAPEMYGHYEQWDSGNTNFPIVVKTLGDPVRVARAVADAVHAVDPGAAVSRVRPMTDVIAASVGRPRFFLTLLGIFAGVALLLAMAGLYGVMSYVVEQRTREIGIRSALGSTQARTLALVLRQGLLLVGAGIVIGLIGATLLTRLLSGLLFGVSPLDIATWTLVTLALIAVAAIAVLVPARRAAAVDPLFAIRIE